MIAGVTGEQILRSALGDRELAPALVERLDAALARWPQLPVGPQLIAFLAERLPKLDQERVPVEDLVLAWWTSTGASDAIAAFETEYAAIIGALLARFHKLPADELRQRLRVKLFVGEAPKVREYRGTGALASWLRVTAARVFVDAARSETARPTTDLDEVDMLGLAMPGGSNRDRQQRLELAAAIKHAFHEAVAGLAPRERTFLRHGTVDELTLEQIAAAYDVHRATVARTLKSARERLLAETRERVLARLGIEVEQLTSALAVLDSKLDLSLSRVLR